MSSWPVYFQLNCIWTKLILAKITLSQIGIGQSILPASEESLNAEIRNSTPPKKSFNNKQQASLKEKHHLGQCFKVEGSVYQGAIKLTQVA